MYAYENGGVRLASKIPEGKPYIEVSDPSITFEAPDKNFLLKIDWENKELYWEEYEAYVPQPDPDVLLREQVKAQGDRVEFLEDCIAEMAQMVYA